MDAITYAICKNYTDKKVDQSAELHREIVDSLPVTGDEKTIYMILNDSDEGSDTYDEYMWIDGAFELIGNTKVDLTDYYNKTQIDTALNDKANKSLLYSGNDYFQFGVDGNGNYGYKKAGADTVTPFKRIMPTTKNITVNKTYNAIDDGYDGYSSVKVNVSGGGGGGNCNIMTNDEWDALTFEQKKTQGLTVIRNTQLDVSGNWFDLSNSSSEYLPYSSNIIGDASINNFDATSHSWGGFTLSNTLTANADGIGVDIFGIPDASQGHPNVEAVYCDLGDVNTDFTAYLVCKYSVDFAYSAIIGASYEESSGNCAYIIEAGMTNVEGVCGGSSVVGSAHTADTYIVLAIRNNNKNISFFKNGVKGTDKIAYNVGRYVTLTTPYPNGTNYCTQITAAYAGVISEAESDLTVLNNINALMQKFNIS